jgi:hypothetical protein
MAERPVVAVVNAGVAPRAVAVAGKVVAVVEAAVKVAAVAGKAAEAVVNAVPAAPGATATENMFYREDCNDSPA